MAEPDPAIKTEVISGEEIKPAENDENSDKDTPDPTSNPEPSNLKPEVDPEPEPIVKGEPEPENQNGEPQGRPEFEPDTGALLEELENAGPHLAQNYIKVRGLPYAYTANDLKEFFADYEFNPVVLYAQNHNGRPTGLAYFQLKDHEEAKRAINELHQTLFRERTVDVFSVDEDDLNRMIDTEKLKRKAGEDCTVIRMRGIPFEAREDDVRNFFEGLDIAPGDEGVMFLIDPMTGRRAASGETFVRFKDRTSAERAYEKHMQNMGHRYIEIFRSTLKEMRIQRELMDPPDVDPYSYNQNWGAMPMSMPPMNKDGRPVSLLALPPIRPRPRWGPPGPGPDWGPYPPRGPPPGWGPRGPPPPWFRGPWGGPPGPPPWQRPYGDMGWGGAGGGGQYGEPPAKRHRPEVDDRKIIMRGLPFKVTAKEIIEFFNGHKVIDVHIETDKKGKATGDGSVTFENSHVAQAALAKDKECIGHRYIDLFLATSPSLNPQLRYLAYNQPKPKSSEENDSGDSSELVKYPSYYYGPQAPQGYPTVDYASSQSQQGAVDPNYSDFSSSAQQQQSAAQAYAQQQQHAYAGYGPASTYSASATVSAQPQYYQTPSGGGGASSGDQKATTDPSTSSTWEQWQQYWNYWKEYNISQGQQQTPAPPTGASGGGQQSSDASYQAQAQAYWWSNYQ